MKKLIVRLLAAYLRSGLRGGGRITEVLSSHFSAFHSVEIETNKGTVIGDLRNPLYRALLVYSEGETEEETVMKMFLRSGDSVFDIGVYLGIYTALMSDLVGNDGEVYSFEPNPKVIPSLRNTASFLGNVTLHEVALSDKHGKVTFYVPKYDASMASLADWTNNDYGIVNTLECKTVPIDDLVSAGVVPQPHFVKCDVEGAEILVFKGGRSIFDREDAPIVFFEVNPSATRAFSKEPDICFQYFQSLEKPKYRFFQVEDYKLKPIDGFQDLKFNEHGFTNAVAIPATKFVETKNIKD